jgi:hypothetical protein
MAYVYDTLNLAEHSSNRLTDDWDGFEQSSLANQDVEQSLVDASELR